MRDEKGIPFESEADPQLYAVLLTHTPLIRPV